MKNYLKAHYHWVIAAVALILTFVHLGIYNNFTGLFIIPITEGIGISRSEFSFIQTIISIVSMTFCFFSGAIFTRFGSRIPCTVGLLCAAASYTLIGLSENTFLLAVAFVLMGASLGLAGTTAITIVTGDWFIRYRGTILGLIMAASGLGGSFFCILQAFWIEKSGYRFALFFTAVILLTVAVLAVITLVSKPKNLGLLPLGEGEEITAKRRKISDEAFPGFSMKELKKRPSFYLMFLCTLLSGYTFYTMFNIIVPHLVDSGLSTAAASGLQSIFLLLITGTKLLTGVACDRFSAKRVNLVCIGAAVICTALFAFTTTWTMGLISLMIYSVATPICTLMVPLLSFSLFGYKAQKEYAGIFISAISCSSLLATPITNLLRDTFGSYRIPLLLGSSVALVVMILYTVLYKMAEKDRALSESISAEAKGEV